MNLLHATQLTLTLGRLLGQDVATERLLVLEAVSGLLKRLAAPLLLLIFGMRELRSIFLENPGPTSAFALAR